MISSEYSTTSKNRSKPSPTTNSKLTFSMYAVEGDGRRPTVETSAGPVEPRCLPNGSEMACVAVAVVIFLIKRPAYNHAPILYHRSSIICF